MNDGTAIPQLGFGTLRVQSNRPASPENVATTSEVVGLALDAGYRHVDTAQSYGTERGVGEAIRAAGIPREELYVVSKLGNGNHRPDDVRGVLADQAQARRRAQRQLPLRTVAPSAASRAIS